MEPQQAKEMGLEVGLKATFVVPDCEFTCIVGQRTLDFFLVSDVLAPHFEVEVDRDSPWWPHKGLKATVKLEILEQKKWIIQKPKGIRLCQGPVRHTWEELEEKARAKQQGQHRHPVCEEHASQDLAREYEVFSRTLAWYLGDADPESEQNSVEYG
eukprot:8471383-Karenia_brevis.AAC.1